ncbi:MAG: nicotinate-nucleotide adenylyltransferase [Deltaproteobacteria bacterium]
MRDHFRTKTLGIMGGTFDPVHYGHLIAAENSRSEFGLDRVIFMPAARPPHKDGECVLDSHHRLKMVKLAIASNPAFEISTLEQERQGFSYTINTVEYFRSRFPESQVFFIMGMDSLLMFDTWCDYERLAGLCRFIVVTRPGYVMDAGNPVLAELPSVLWENLSMLEIPGMDISSSDIRRRVQLGLPIKYMVPAVVEDYIQEHRLYREEESRNV